MIDLKMTKTQVACTETPLCNMSEHVHFPPGQLYNIQIFHADMHFHI